MKYADDFYGETMKLLKNFTVYDAFLRDRSDADEHEITMLFDKVADEFENMQEEKLSYPNNFVRDLRLYKNKNTQIVEYFEDVEKRYLLLSDLYDYARIKGKI